jgi:hypothetical protein
MDDFNLLYNPKFIEFDELIIPEWELNNFKSNSSLLTTREAEDNELFLSVTSILDYFENNAELEEDPWYDSESSDFLKAWEIAKELVNLWGNKLLSQFPSYSFHVSANRLDQPKIRFYKIRNQEIPVQLSSNDHLSILFKGN